MEIKAIPLRLERGLARSVQTLATSKGMSVNKLITEAMEQYIQAETDRAWRESFEAMSLDPECVDVEYAIHAQSEVALANPE